MLPFGGWQPPLLVERLPAAEHIAEALEVSRDSHSHLLVVDEPPIHSQLGTKL